MPGNCFCFAEKLFVLFRGGIVFVPLCGGIIFVLLRIFRVLDCTGTCETFPTVPNLKSRFPACLRAGTSLRVVRGNCFALYTFILFLPFREQRARMDVDEPTAKAVGGEILPMIFVVSKAIEYIKNQILDRVVSQCQCLRLELPSTKLVDRTIHTKSWRAYSENFPWPTLRPGTNDAKNYLKYYLKITSLWLFDKKCNAGTTDGKTLPEIFSEAKRRTDRKARYAARTANTTGQCARCLFGRVSPTLCSSWPCYPIIR